MAVDVYTNPETLDFELTATGDLKTTADVVQQDAWKRVMLPKGNFTFDGTLGSLLYRIPQYGNTRAARELAAGYIRLALEDDVRAGRLRIEAIEVDSVTPFGFTARLVFQDLTTNQTTSIDF